ncbi:MAG: DUF1552 domain-containing protein [Verrucomicrobiales bacterium]|nr:DUF1552 domain-containing protein [Verrucomicrobiales bacterium]
MNSLNRRHFLRQLGVSATAAPFLSGLPGIGSALAADAGQRKRLIIMFSPNGTIPGEFWPDQTGIGYQTKRILKPLDAYRDRMTLLNGISNRIGGDGDRHMRGMSCLLTGTELLPGNIQGGSDTPAGWAGGISIDQELKNFFQSNAATETRFGSLEFGVAIPNRADPWTRMSYTGPNEPVAPIDDPGRIIEKLYGKMGDKESLVSVVDDVREDLKRIAGNLGADDRALLDQHLGLVADLEQELARQESDEKLVHPMPEIDPTIELVNENTPRISRMQIDLLVNSLANDMSRIATLQYMRSVGQARMNWLGVDEGHHGLSHEPDNNANATEKLIQINEWFAGELAYLVERLDNTPEPGADGSMLDNTLVVWLNELGKGNNHTLENIPFVLIGGEKATGFNMGRHLQMPKNTPHNRLWLSIAQSMGHDIGVFGNAKYCEAGPLDLVNDMPPPAVAPKKPKAKNPKPKQTA